MTSQQRTLLAIACCVLLLSLFPDVAFAQASTTPFSNLGQKFLALMGELKIFVGIAVAAFGLWTILTLAQGNGMAWGRLGLTVFGLVVLNDYENIIGWFGGFTVQ